MKSYALKELIKGSKYPTQRELAAAVGVHTNLVHKWVNGYCVPTSKNLVKLSTILGISKSECYSLCLNVYALKHNGKTRNKPGRKKGSKSSKAVAKDTPTGKISKPPRSVPDENPTLTKFCDMSCEEQLSYVFHRLISSGASVSAIGLYLQGLESVGNSVYTQFDLLAALTRMYNDRYSITFDIYSPIHNTITEIAEEIRKENLT